MSTEPKDMNPDQLLQELLKEHREVAIQENMTVMVVAMKILDRNAEITTEKVLRALASEPAAQAMYCRIIMCAPKPMLLLTGSDILLNITDGVPLPSSAEAVLTKLALACSDQAVANALSAPAPKSTHISMGRSSSKSRMN